jgi:hypothetical protein
VASALALGLLSAAPALAQPAAPPSGAGKPSIDWTMQDLLADPAAKAVLEKDIPGISDDPRLGMVMAMTLRAVAQYPEAQIDQAKLDRIAADLAALPAKPAS